MTGSGRQKIQETPEISPASTPVPGRVEEEAKKKVRKRARRTGRESTILAGRLMSGQGNNILNTSLAPR